jgi:hypothetical protein
MKCRETLTHDRYIRVWDADAATIAEVSVAANTANTVVTTRDTFEIRCVWIELSPGPRYNQVQIDERCFVTFDVTLEQRIRELCAQAVAAQDTAELQPILAELRHALREHLEQLKSMVTEYPFSH